MLETKSLQLRVAQCRPLNAAWFNRELASLPSSGTGIFKRIIYTVLLIAVAAMGKIAPAQSTEANFSLRHHVPRQVMDGTATRTSHYGSDQKLRLVLSIRPPHMAEEEAFLKEQQTKGAPNFHKFLTAEEWNARFAPSTEDEQKVVDWAKSQGLTVTRRYSHRLIVDLEGTVDNIEKAFGVTINKYQLNGEEDFSNDRDPLLPASLTNIVGTVQGMNNIQREHGSAPGSEKLRGADYIPGPVVSSANNVQQDAGTAQQAANSNSTDNLAAGVNPNGNAVTNLSITGNSVPPLNNNGFMDPQNLFSSEAYDYAGLYALSHCCNVHNDSTGSPAVSSIAIVGWGNYLTSDILGFANTYDLAVNLTTYNINGTPGCGNNFTPPPPSGCATGETTEDIEWSIATSNSFGSYNTTSHVYAYLGGNFNLGTYTTIYSDILDDNSTRVMTTSWSCTENYDCGYDNGTIGLEGDTSGDNSVIGSRHAIFNQMVGMGWTLIAASGDRGASDDCQNGNTNNSNTYVDPNAHTSVAYPASDSDFVAAGGTQIRMNQNGTWQSEQAWQGGTNAGSCQGNGGGGGGGVSIYFDQPYWQNPLSSLGSKRLSPDISMNALGQGQNLYINGGLNGDANGTSVVAPELAGFFAQENTYLNYIGNICGSKGDSACTPVGLPNWEIYGAATAGAPHDPFYNMLSGCNNNDATQLDKLKYFCAGPGHSYDIPTWGTQYDLVSGLGSINVMQLAWAINWELIPAYGSPSINFPASNPATNTWYNSNQTVSWTLSDSGSSGLPAPGPAGFTQGWDSIPADPYSEPHGGTGNSFYTGPQYPFATGGCLAFNNNGCAGGSGQGCHTVRVEGWDNQGRTTYGSYGPLCYDSVAPTVAVTNNPVKPSTGWYNGPVKVSLSATDPGGSNASGIKQTYYQINYSGCYPGFIDFCGFYSTPFTLSAQGQYTVTYFTQDVAGNYSGEYTDQINIDLSSPVTTASLTGGLFNAPIYETEVAVKLTSTDSGGSGIAATYYSLDGGPQTTYTGIVTVSLVGNHSIKYWSVNRAGTTGAAGITSFSIESPTTTSLGVLPNPSTPGQAVTLTAFVTATIAGNTPAGSVTFLNGTTTIGTASLINGVATLSTSTLAVGSHSLSAHYVGTFSYMASTSLAVADVVLQKTTTTLSSSANPATYGSSVKFTAKVTPSISGTPTGSVQFFSGATALGSAPLSGGSASLSVSTLAKGNDTITAIYSGDSVYAKSTSAYLSETINAASTTTAISSSVNPSAYKQPVTFTATVSSAGGTPTGTVTFRNGSTSLGSETLNGSGQASLTTPNLPLGALSITATYNATTDFSTSTSSALSQTVNPDQTTTTLSSSLNPSTFGATVKFTATVTSAVTGTTPTGTVTFKNGSTVLGTGTLSGGVATLSTSTLPLGDLSITAAYGATTDFGSSTSSTVLQAVNADQTKTTLTSSLNPATFGKQVTFTAKVTSAVTGEIPTGTVTFKDGATILGTETLSSGVTSFTATALPVGTNSISASYNGAVEFSSSTSAISQVVNKASTTTTLTSSLNPSTYNAQVTFTVKVSSSVVGSTPSGSVSLLVNGISTLGTLNSSGVATFPISSLQVSNNNQIAASYGGDANFNGSSATAIDQVVKAAATTTTVGTSLSPSAYGQQVTLMATVTSTAGTPGGTVTFKSGSTVLGTGTLNGSGKTSLTTAAMAVGAHSITAVYGGTTDFVTSTSAAVSQVVAADQTSTTLSSSLNPSHFKQTVTFTATVTSAVTGEIPTGTVTFKSGANTIGSGALIGGVATFTTSTLAVGTASITADYAGVTDFVTSTSAALPQVVNPDTTTTSVTSSLSSSVVGQSVKLTATVTSEQTGTTPTGTVTFKTQLPGLASVVVGTSTLSNGVATFTTSALALGKNSITATYNGATDFSASTSSAISDVVGP